MRKAAVVVADLGGFKEIEVSRSSACEGCSQNKDGSCHACIALGDKNRAMRTKARDELGAEVGDRVIVETDSGTVIRYAAEVFLLPILLAAVGYFVGGLIGGFVVLALSFFAYDVEGHDVGNGFAAVKSLDGEAVNHPLCVFFDFLKCEHRVCLVGF